MSAAKTLLTAEEFDNYPFEEDKRYELDEVESIEMTRPAYKHNRVMRSAWSRRSPDLAVILGDRHEELQDAKVIPIVPDIAAEVLSPSETPRMIHRKLKQYFAAGVKEVWLIDPESREVDVWTGPALPARGRFTSTHSSDQANSMPSRSCC